jgi:hypothetical protein
MQLGVLRKQADAITEPRAAAPDARVYFSIKPYCLAHPRLTLASGATALRFCIGCVPSEGLTPTATMTAAQQTNSLRYKQVEVVIT